MKKQSKEISDLLEDDHAETLEKTNRLQEILLNLRYEGRPSWKKNLKDTRGVLEFFKQELVEHVELEERVLFPFLETHFPKLESALHLLRAEHEDFKMNLRLFESQLRELSKEREGLPRGKIIEKIRESGTYLIYLLRNHLHAENESLYKVIDRELREDEKQKLQRQIRERNKERK